MDTLLLHVFPCRLPEVGSVLNVERRHFCPHRSHFRSHDACLLGFPGNISCARLVEEPVIDHKITVFLRLLGAVGTSTRADACAFSGEPQLPRAS